jgi:hypothetical protein
VVSVASQTACGGHASHYGRAPAGGLEGHAGRRPITAVVQEASDLCVFPYVAVRAQEAHEWRCKPRGPTRVGIHSWPRAPP